EQIRVVAGAEEALGTVEEARVVLAPFHTFAGAEILERPRLDVKEILHDGVGARQIHRTLRVGKTERLFRAQRELARRLVVLLVAAGRLVGEPLAHVALVRRGALRQLLRSERALRELAIQAELIADEDEHRTDRRTEVAYCLAEERVEPGFVEGHVDLPI